MRLNATRAVALANFPFALVVGCKRAEQTPPEEIRPARAAAPRKAGETVSLTGTVQAQPEVNYAFRIDGRLVRRAVNVGDEVRPGQLLAQLDPSNEQSSLKNAVILVEQIEVDREEGKDVWNAVISAASSRLRPLSLTALSTVLGLIPIAPTVFWGPMAFAIMGGLLIATLLMLVFLPALYLAVSEVRADRR
jgi:multidrug efflux pump subunit AcrA (membrane-fusion protein)